MNRNRHTVFKIITTPFPSHWNRGCQPSIGHQRASLWDYNIHSHLPDRVANWRSRSVGFFSSRGHVDFLNGFRLSDSRVEMVVEYEVELLDLGLVSCAKWNLRAFFRDIGRFG
ncbi:hypothetical protein CDAR_517971 [Caerostris darwini]|uniref:Uncharacterized protein n=1 Tax=Caerostris darwini TaxID=1538125 RepID=A0AAV4QUV1_9ARAC|nr:hypothetical protein CDAR_517971 [Caerostris darwini]